MGNSHRPSRELTVELDPTATTPLFLQIARAISNDVRRGRLRAGQVLPGSRTLADSLGVHRNTVLAALRELAAEGYVETDAARATYISRELPEARVSERARGRRDTVGFPLRVASEVEVVSATLADDDLPLLGGIPDLVSVPRAALARAYRRALISHPRLLGYGDPRGDRLLREALSDNLRDKRGLATTSDDVLVTRGSQMALDLVARVLLGRGDTVVVEALGYRPAWDALGAYGARLVSVPVDEHGIDVDALTKLVRRRKIRAIYVTPHHQYPTTSMLSAARRLALLELARVHGFAIVEDDYDHELNYDGRPVLPLAARDEGGTVVYIGTLSKVLAPGLRVGYVVAPKPVRDALVRARVRLDRQGDLVLERALANLYSDGEIQRHALRMRRVYRARRDKFAALLHDTFGERLTFTTPPGGMALWVRASGVDVDAWAERAKKRRVIVQTARQFTFDGKRPPFLRLGFAALDERRLAKAVGVLKACWDAT